MVGLLFYFVVTEMTAGGVNNARARFVAEDASEAFTVILTQNGRTQTCSTDVLNPRTCELRVDVGEAHISVTGARHFSFRHTYPEGLSVHRLKWRPRWPIYVGGAFVGVGIAAVGVGVSYALRCANGTPIEKVTACGGTADVGYVLGGIFAALGVTGIVGGAIATGNLTTTENERRATAASPEVLRFVPQLTVVTAKQGALAQAQWAF